MRFFLGMMFSLSTVAWGAPQQLKHKPFKVCGRKVDLELASNPEERSLGLGDRTSLAKGKGMAFVFEVPQMLTFWMKNVTFDIDIGFFDAKGKLLSFETMKGESPMVLDDALPRYSSPGEARYAIELPRGFFKAADRKGCRVDPLP